MRKILYIYKTDLHRIAFNWAAAVVIGGLVILPSLYAWFNILASWDPYGQTSNLSIAVANSDTGATIQNKPINAGKQIVDSLKNNHNIGWVFTTPEAAKDGVERGKFYASIEIPANFSQSIATVLSDNPQKAEILYEVNEKINAVAPKITAKGASSIVEEVSKNFVETANGAIFKVFNEIGVELQEQLPLIERLTALVTKLETHFPEINNAAGIAVNDLTESGSIISNMQTALPEAADLADKGIDAATSLSDFLEKNKSELTSAAPAVKSSLAVIQQTAAEAANAASLLQSLPAEQLTQEAARLLALNQAPLTAATEGATGISELLARLAALDESSPQHAVLSDVSQKAADISGKLSSLAKLNNALLAAAEQGTAVSAAELAQLASLAGEISAAAGDLLDRYDSEIQPAILKTADGAETAAKEAAKLLSGAKQTLPQIADILNDAAAGVKKATGEAEVLQKLLPSAEQKVSDLASRLRSLEKEGDLQKLISLLELNFKKESQFFAEPVVLKEHDLFPIPNYGSAMSPFFTTLSLWVGGLLLVSLLSVDVHDQGEGQTPYRNVHIYVGRYLTFATLAVLQSLFVTIGDLLLLHTFAAEPYWFVPFGVCLSLVFMLMIYTLVSVFGNVGKAMAIVLLVLQLAGSGGTFPIQVTPPFFQAVYPFLPFTYAIRIMREAVGGILWDVVAHSLLMLLLFAAISLAVGLGFKGIINAKSAKLVKKAKESRLIH